MKAIHSLIHSLNRSEQRITRAALTAFSNRKDTNTKSLVLFEFILKNKDHIPPNSECASHIYKDPKDKRFKMLKLRFRQKLLDSISMDMNLYKKEMFDPTDQGNVKVRKKVAQLFHLYFSKGNQAILKNLLDEIIHLSTKYEHYSSLIDALRFRKYSKGYIKGEADFIKINQQISYYERCNQAVHKANDSYYRLMVLANFNARLDNTKMQLYLEESIVDLKQEYQFTKSPLVGYFFKLLEITYHENNQNYLSALNSCSELLDIVKNNKSVYRKSRLCVVYLNLCQFNIFLQKYVKAVYHARQAQSLVAVSSNYYLISLEWEFNALFNENRLEEAEKSILTLIDKATDTKDDDFGLAKYRFYYSSVLFKKENYKGVLKELDNTHEIAKDKEGYNTAIQLLRIMTLIELDRADEVIFKLDNLRKHLERNLEKDNTRKREKIILQILISFEKSGFSSKSDLDKKIISNIKLLESDNKAYKWLPLSSELIPFQTWFSEKFITKKSNVKM